MHRVRSSRVQLNVLLKSSLLCFSILLHEVAATAVKGPQDHSKTVKTTEEADGENGHNPHALDYTWTNICIPILVQVCVLVPNWNEA